MKTVKAMVLVEVRVADVDDEDEIREAIKESLQESLEDDTLDYSVEEYEEE